MLKSSAGFFSVGIPKLTPDPNTVLFANSKMLCQLLGDSKKPANLLGDFIPSILYQNIKVCEIAAGKSKNFTKVVRCSEFEPFLLLPTERHWEQRKGIKKIQKESNSFSSLEERSVPLPGGAHTFEKQQLLIHTTQHGIYTYSCQAECSVQSLFFQKGSCTH